MRKLTDSEKTSLVRAANKAAESIIERGGVIHKPGCINNVNWEGKCTSVQYDEYGNIVSVHTAEW